MIIIPARLASTRFPQKVITDVDGLPMVVRTAKRVAHLDRVVVAADDETIISICKEHNIEAMLTSTTHKSGTDRINECASILNVPDDELIINVQADEPFIEPDVVVSLIKRLKIIQNNKESFIMGSCFNAINNESAKDPDLVKVVLDSNDNATKVVYVFSFSSVTIYRYGIYLL